MIDTGIWVALTVAAPAAVRVSLPRFRRRIAPWEAELAFWGRAGYGVVPLYGAWVTGAVAARDCGISGIGTTQWLIGAGICAVLLLMFSLGLRVAGVRRWAQLWFHPTRSSMVLFDEPRWAFYRGAAAVVLGTPAAAQLAGLALGGLEWLARFGRPSRPEPGEVWSQLVRLAVSAGLFALTHNLWLVLLTQAAAAAIILRSWSGSASAN